MPACGSREGSASGAHKLPSEDIDPVCSCALRNCVVQNGVVGVYPLCYAAAYPRAQIWTRS